MTVIVANRDIMAADRQTTHGDQKFHSTKIFKIRRSLFGMAGDAVQCEEFINWKRGGERPEEFDELEVLELTPHGLYAYICSSSRMKIDDGFYAIGSGSQAALAAMHLGLSPVQAAEIAIKIDPSCGGGVDYLEL